MARQTGPRDERSRPLVLGCSSRIALRRDCRETAGGVDSAADTSQVDHTSAVAVYGIKRREIKWATLDWKGHSPIAERWSYDCREDVTGGYESRGCRSC